MNLLIGAFSYSGINKYECTLYNFLYTVRKYNDTCKIVIICKKDYYNDNLKKLFQDFNATPILIENDKNIILERLNCYYYFLLNDENTYDKILISDMDDVFFFGDPFSIKFDTDFYLSNEGYIFNGGGSSHSYFKTGYPGACRAAMWNIDKIKEYYKEDTSNNLKLYDNKYIICAGTILGKYNAILDFLKFYNSVQEKYNLNDQAVLNIYIYTITGLTYTSLLPNESQILLLNSYKIEELAEDNKYFNVKNERFLIFHYNGRSKDCKHNREIINNIIKFL